jgi:hypothetical protein
MEEGDRSELEMEEGDRFPATDSQGLVFFFLVLFPAICCCLGVLNLILGFGRFGLIISGELV